MPSESVREIGHPLARLRGLIDYLTTAVLVLGRGSAIEQMNSAAETLLDTSMQAARDAPLSELVAAGELLDAVDRVFESEDPLTERALPNHPRHGTDLCRRLHPDAHRDDRRTRRKSSSS